MKQITIIVTQPPYGKEDAFGAIPMASVQASVGNEACIVFVSGGVHSVVKGQVTGYGDLAVWLKEVPPVEAEIKKNIEVVKFYALDRDLERRGIKEEEIIEGVEKIDIIRLTDLILESDTTLVF